jgi:hypothetical protein
MYVGRDGSIGSTYVSSTVDAYNCKTMEELQDCIEEEWEKLDKGVMEIWKQARSMPQRYQTVIHIDAQG